MAQSLLTKFPNFRQPHHTESSEQTASLNLNNESIRSCKCRKHDYVESCLGEYMLVVMLLHLILFVSVPLMFSYCFQYAGFWPATIYIYIPTRSSSKTTNKYWFWWLCLFGLNRSQTRATHAILPNWQTLNTLWSETYEQCDAHTYENVMNILWNYYEHARNILWNSNEQCSQDLHTLFILFS